MRMIAADAGLKLVLGHVESLEETGLRQVALDDLAAAVGITGAVAGDVDPLVEDAVTAEEVVVIDSAAEGPDPALDVLSLEVQVGILIADRAGAPIPANDPLQIARIGELSALAVIDEKVYSGHLANWMVGSPVQTNTFGLPESWRPSECWRAILAI